MLAGPPGLLLPGPRFPLGDRPTYFCHPLHNPPYADALCFSLSVTALFFFLLFFFFFSLAHSHLPQCWTASNRAWWLKEMSVHSLIIPQRAVVLTVLIQSYRASWNCSLVVSHGSLWVFVRVCVCVLVVNLSLLSSCVMALLSVDCAVLQEGENSFSQLVTHSLSLTLPFSFGILPHPRRHHFFFFLLRGTATAGQTCRQDYAWGSPKQLADSEVQ